MKHCLSSVHIMTLKLHLTWELCCCCRNGEAYAGEYFADKMHGFGVYHFANVHKYEGAWHEGRRQGLGMYTFRNGETQAGHWEDGILSCATEQTIRPGSSFTISHSKVVDAVEVS